MGDFQNTKMYTHDRLSNFINNYTNYVDQLLATAQTQGDLYVYNHYEYSPNGITMTPLGRLPATALANLAPWAANSGVTNTPDGWKMNLGIQYNTIKTEDQSSLGATSTTPGLQYKAIVLPNSAYSTNPNTFLANSPSIINLFSEASGNVILQQGTASSMDTYANAFQDPNGQIPAQTLNQGGTTFATEWYGFFKPAALGNYIFSIDLGNTGGYVYMWVGNKAVCEYIPQNSDIAFNRRTFTYNVLNPGYYPIRIQYYNAIDLQNPSAFTFGLTVQQQSISGTLTDVPTSSCFNVINGGTYVPRIQYCAFVSQSPTYLKSGKFLCYMLTLDPYSPTDLAQFYQTLNQYKFGMQSQQYDTLQGVVQFGQLPDGTTYTPVSSDVNSLPECFSIYRLDVDLRMGKTFQINTQANADNLYMMNQINPNPPPPNNPVLSFAGNYHELPNYYPNAPAGDMSIYNQATNVDGEACKLACNANQNCNHYFTYTSNGSPQCIIDTTNSIPNFNQIQPTTGTVQPVDAGSSSLFMRNLQFVEPTCNGMNSGGTVAGPIANVKTVANVNAYNNSVFPYSSYTWSPDMISSVTDIGVCGDARFRVMTNDAASILFKNATYSADGTWTVNGQAGQDTQQWSAWQPGTAEGFQTVATVVAPGPETKYTDAISDTADAIQANLYNERQYGQLMDAINRKYNQLSQHDIPKYVALRDELNNTYNADFSGNTLLYLRNKPIPTVQEKHIMDIQEQNTSQNLVYVLGTLTVATLLVLAMVIARE